MKTPPQNYTLFIEAPESLDELCAKAFGWDSDFEIAYRDNGIEFTFRGRVAVIQFLLFTRSIA